MMSLASWLPLVSWSRSRIAAGVSFSWRRFARCWLHGSLASPCLPIGQSPT